MSEPFLITLKSYLYSITDTLWNLWFPLIMLGGFILITLIVALIYGNRMPKDNKDSEDKPLTITRKVLCSLYLSGVVTLFTATFVVISLLKFTAFFSKTFCQFGVVIGFLIVSAFTFISYLQLCKKTKRKEMSLVDVPISNDFLNRKINHLKKVLKHKLVLFLIVALPFLMLMISNSKQSLVSIVLDNSNSMYEYLPYGINSLETVLAQTPHNGQYVFTTLDIIKSKEIKDTTVNQYFESIVNTKNPSQLPTRTETFTSTRELINAFSQVGDAGGSAIIQGIWQNYLSSRDFSASSWQTKKLIVISDGMDNLYKIAGLPNQHWDKKDIFKQKDQVGQTPAEFFDGGIYCINLGGDESKYLWGDCAASITIYDGTNQQSYFNALVGILPEMFFDWYFIYILAGMLVVTFLALLITKSTVK